MKYFFFILTVAFWSKVFAQTEYSDYLATPYESIRTHLHYLQEGTYNDTLAALPFLQNSPSNEEAVKKSVQLKQILDGRGIYIEISVIPNNPNYYDSLMSGHFYSLAKDFPGIALEKQGNNWVYTKASMQAIDKYHHQVFQFGTGKIIELFPRAHGKKFLGLYRFQLIGILILALISTLVHKILVMVFGQFLANIFKKRGFETFASKAIKPVTQPLSLFIVLYILTIFLPVLMLPPEITHYLILVVRGLLPFCATIVSYRLVNVLSIYLQRLADKTENALDDHLIPLLRKTLKTFIILLGTLFILDNLEINILPVLTGLSIGGLAFALAAQDTIKNFFGSLMIFIDKPFQIGDWITSGEIDGNVEEVGFRSSRIRTFRNSLMYVPNGVLADSVIDNHGLRTYRRYHTSLALRYDTPPDLITIFMQGLEKIVLNHKDTRKDYYNIFLNELDASSLRIMFYIFFKVPDWGEELRARHEVIMEVLKLAKALSIEFAFPTQTLTMENISDPKTLPNYKNVQQANETFDQYFNINPK